jgi:hypothetical protein
VARRPDPAPDSAIGSETGACRRIFLLIPVDFNAVRHQLARKTRIVGNEEGDIVTVGGLAKLLEQEPVILARR